MWRAVFSSRAAQNSLELPLSTIPDSILFTRYPNSTPLRLNRRSHLVIAFLKAPDDSVNCISSLALLHGCAAQFSTLRIGQIASPSSSECWTPACLNASYASQNTQVWIKSLNTSLDIQVTTKATRRITKHVRALTYPANHREHHQQRND